MANRRSGGMGGGLRGNRSFSQHQPFQGNPWQGSNSMNQGLISNPQQLALALSNLLQPQQQMNNPPSLLSLNTSPGFSDQDRNFNRFGNRGRELRRHEPYSKNRGGWRDRKDQKGNQNKKKSDQKKDDKDQKDEEKKEGAEGEDAEGEKTGEEKENGEDKEGIYHGVPKKLLNCFVCHKEMWDGESMQKHVRGRAHRQMLDTLEESIHLTVNILREHSRLSEEKKIIEFNRMQRVTKKFGRGHNEIHCNMCDLKFMGQLAAHRKTEGHQRLKRYLHPNCTLCEKEFPSRIEWVEHRLTPEHLRKLQETLKDDTDEDGEGDVLIDEGEPDLEPILEESLQLESEFPIFELDQDLNGLQNLIPAYKPDRAVSKQSLKEFSGFRCELCRRSFESEELAQKHLKSKMHYHSFITAAKNKYQDAIAKKEKEEKEEKERLEKEKAEEEEKAAKENGDAEMAEAEDASEVKEETDNTVEDAEMLEEEETVVKKEEEKKEEPKVTESPAARPTRNAGAATPAKTVATPAAKAKRGRK